MGVCCLLTWQASMLLQQARFGALQECLRRYAVAVTLRRFSDSLHVSLEPLQDENEGIFSLTLSRPSARNAIGVFLLKYCGTLKLAARTPHIDSLILTWKHATCKASSSTSTAPSST